MCEHWFPEMGRWVSIFDRLMKMYYDRGLSEFEIGWGPAVLCGVSLHSSGCDFSGDGGTVPR